MKMIKKNTRQLATKILWILLIGCTSFGIYKSLTAIDKHTVHETKVVEKQLVDTTGIISFVEDFGKVYFSWEPKQELLDNRLKSLANYVTDDLLVLNQEVIRSDIPTKSTVRDISIWEIVPQSENLFEVSFSVRQLIEEGKEKREVNSSYRTTVYQKHDSFVIVQNPTISSAHKKSDYTPAIKEADGTVDTETTQEITTFLETFFKLYPTATENELTYYVSNDALQPIHKNYVFSELVNPVYFMKDGKIKVSVIVKYLDQETKAIQISQFEITLVKQDNWKIISNFN
ncbi:TPA: conjugal transfer protein [Enterococcus faecium]